MDVKADPKHLSKLLDVTKGVRQVPVIVDGGTITVGFGGT
ncbi:putative glutaredoxin-related protein [Megalodesulfovibrio gigas DSM 1382 = ATCC 19364]|uniref:Putative glutaredoxin-related protein n=1 Tax=Megalodesulfovibrio gigas (strain ATCC 19364 / DSM 1382 / NCIMB 9332 / VKM B-1759) TaxID=1121448 RepID=T2GC67_MEGG1|nr:putative glutaredoxin-related protein [Megalodesulfovibrio gigas DSM 1382 = ATCC 19364]